MFVSFFNKWCNYFCLILILSMLFWFEGVELLFFELFRLCKIYFYIEGYLEIIVYYDRKNIKGIIINYKGVRMEKVNMDYKLDEFVILVWVVVFIIKFN